jgi:hypothetical protein
VIARLSGGRVIAKAIVGAAELAGAAALFALGPATFGLSAALGASLMTSLAVGGISMEAGAIADALTQNRGMGITTRQPAAFRQVIYGEQRVGGTIIYQSTTGSQHDQYNFVIVLAGHEIDSIVNLYLDGRQVFWEGSGDGWLESPGGVYFGGNADSNNHTGPNGQQYNFGGKVYCSAFYGNQTQGSYFESLNANDPTWGPTSAGAPSIMSCAAVYLKLEFDPALFPSLPEIKFTVRGKNNIYDPRTGTTGYTSNWALVVADVITDPVFGLGDNSVNQDQLVAAANICDEQITLAQGGTEAQYACHYHYDTSTAPGDVLQTMMNAAMGRLSRIGGEWYIWPAAWVGPSFSWDESALTSDLDFKPYRKFRDLVNCVNGTYIAANFPWNIAGNLYDSNGFYDGQIQDNFPFAFQPTNYPQYAADTLHGYTENLYLTEDGNVTLPLELTQQCVLSISQAQRCAKIALMRNRQQGTYTLPMNLTCLQMQPLDVMQFTFPLCNWSDKLMEITGVTWGVTEGENDGDAPSIRLQFSAQDVDPSVYEWNPSTEQLSPYDVPYGGLSGTPYTVAAPTNVTAVSNSTTAITNSDGIVTPQILVSWTAPADVLVVYVQVEYQLAGATEWTQGPLVSASSTSAYITGVVSGQSYNVQVTALRANGVGSAAVEVTGVAVSAPSSQLATNTYSTNPQFDLTNPTSTSIDMGAVAVTFGANTVNYAARTFTIATPSVPTWYYVTIADPTQAGDPTSGTPLTATCQASNALVGVQGNTYIGAIQAYPAGGSGNVLAGGWPAPTSFQFSA